MMEKLYIENNASSTPQNVKIEQHSPIGLEGTSSSSAPTTSVHQRPQAVAASLTQNDKAHHGSTSTTL